MTQCDDSDFKTLLMAGKAVTQILAKPELRGHAQRYIRKHLTIAVSLALIGAVSWKYLVAEPRKRRYAEFYKNYDVEKEEQRLISLGLYDNPFPFDE